MIISSNTATMATVRKTVTFTDQQDKWIKAQITAGDFTNDSEYLRHLVRLDQSKGTKFSNMKSAISKGIESGISDSTIPDIMKKVEDGMKEDGRL
jgi:antitoxin ParD1/3/4